jgi:hypothetical protein
MEGCEGSKHGWARQASSMAHVVGLGKSVVADRPIETVFRGVF